MGLVERLETVTRRELLRRLPADASGELVQQDLHELVMTYGGWRYRHITQRPRRVHRSREYLADPRRSRHADGLAALEADLEAGRDLTPRLSRGVRTAYLPTDRAARYKHHRRPDLDLLLSEWGVHHLHLGVGPDSRDPTLVQRTDDLLFGIFDQDDAYLIGIYRHGEWALDHIVETTVRTWPAAELFQSVPGALGLTQNYSEDARRRLREAGASGPLQIDGNVYMPPGQTAAGTPLVVSRQAMKLRAELDAWRDDPMQYLQDVEGVPRHTYWRPAVHRESCGFMASSTFVPVGHLVPADRFHIA